MGNNLIIDLMKEEYESHLRKVIQEEKLKVFDAEGNSTIAKDTKVTHISNLEYTVKSIEPHKIEPGLPERDVKITLRKPDVPRPVASANAKRVGISNDTSEDDYFVVDLETFESEYEV